MESSNRISALFSLAGRTALVTGGTSGIGTMIARGLLMAGARVFIVGREIARTEAAAAELSEYGECLAIAADIAQTQGRAALVGEVERRAGDLCILFNNAGITAHAPYGDYPESHFDEVFGLNVKAPFMLVQSLFPILKSNATASRPSQVVNTGSIAALVTTTPDSYAYGPSKSAVHHMTRVLARKFAPDHVNVNAIAPGLFPSRMSAWITEDPSLLSATVGRIPAGRLGDADDVAALVAYIASSAYLTGAVIPLDGGLSL